MSAEPAVWHGRAFGLHLTAPQELETLSECPAGEDTASVSWTRTADRDVLVPDWPGDGVTRLVDLRFRDGRPMMSIDTDAAGAYLVESPGYGAHLVSPDGARITSVLSLGASWEWQRLFVAQALPLAAAIRGLEPLHASAVSIDGRVIAFSAPSQTGKTSIALHLVAGGATLVTDDVLAVEMTPSELRAHPGARLIGANRSELAAVPEGRERLGAVLGEEDKVYLRPPLESRPLPLAALYTLVRQPTGGSFRIVEQTPPDPPTLLSLTFLTYLNTPQRLDRHLELASRFARTTRVFVVHLPGDVSAARSAELLEQHARADLPVPCGG